ncbi:uncharacterized protein [Solanum lycopersicum]|uniref:uncharacterized protein n=1 Tax=Solanum lycopersicum TaxID=4081 RepID=UPI003749A74F
MARVEDMLHKMMRRFDANDENIKELRRDLGGIGQKVDTHAISIKQTELQMAQLCATVNTRQPGTLTSNIVQNLKNDGHYMAITNRDGKQTIEPPMPSKEKKVIIDNAKVIEGSGEVEDNTRKDAEVPIKLSITVPLVEALEQMLDYAKFMKDLVTKKRSVTFEDDDRVQHCSDIATRSLVQKKEDQGTFTIPCTVGSLYFAKALCDLGASINLMPLSVYKNLDLDDPKPIAMRLLMADRTMKRPIGILHDVLVKVESFIFPADFFILDYEVNFEVPIIIGRPFSATGRSLVDMEKGR